MSAKRLYHAICYGRTRKALKIIEACPWLAWNVASTSGSTMHEAAAFMGNVDVLKALVDLYPRGVLVRGFEGSNALEAAAMAGFAHIVDLVLDRVPDVIEERVLAAVTSLRDDGTLTKYLSLVSDVSDVYDVGQLDAEIADINHRSVVERVLGIQPNLAIFLEKTLMKAALTDNAAVVKVVLESMPRALPYPPFTHTALLTACHEGAAGVLMAFLDAGVFDSEALAIASQHDAMLHVIRRFYSPSRVFKRQLGV